MFFKAFRLYSMLEQDYLYKHDKYSFFIFIKLSNDLQTEWQEPEKLTAKVERKMPTRWILQSSENYRFDEARRMGLGEEKRRIERCLSPDVTAHKSISWKQVIAMHIIWISNVMLFIIYALIRSRLCYTVSPVQRAFFAATPRLASPSFSPGCFFLLFFFFLFFFYFGETNKFMLDTLSESIANKE